MADTQVNALTAATSAADTDIGYLGVDAGGGSFVPRKITIANLMKEAWGEVSVNAGAGSQVLVAATWTKVSQFTANGISKATTPDHTNDRVRVTNAGTYLATFSVSFTTASTAVAMEFGLYYNGALVQARANTWSEGSNVAHVAASGLVTATAGTDFELYMRSPSTPTVVITEAVLSVVRIA